MKRKFVVYRLWVIGAVMFLSSFQTGCFAQIKENLKEGIPENTTEEAQDPYTWDFGEVEQEEVVTHFFVITNDSEKTLHIDSVNSSCGCTASKVENDTLSPGESTRIEVKFNSKGYSGDITQHVYINTDDADNPVIKLTIKANVIK